MIRLLIKSVATVWLLRKLFGPKEPASTSPTGESSLRQEESQVSEQSPKPTKPEPPPVPKEIPIAPKQVKSKAAKPEPPPRPQKVESAPAVHAKRLVVIIGLDFGTSSTKILYRVRDDIAAKLVIPDPHVLDNYPYIASPSLVAIHDGRMHFGSKVFACSKASLIRGLKTRLIHDSASSSRALIPGYGAATADFLTAMYLAWILTQTRKRIELREGTTHVDWRTNVAAPMSQFENRELKCKYRRILHAAWQLAFERRDEGEGLSIEEGLASVAAFLREDAALPAESDMPYAVMPETLAPLVSLGSDARFQVGKYLVADIGAGTTELSINFFPSPSQGFPVSCYADQSLPLGMESLVDNGGTVRPAELDSLVQEARRTWHFGFKTEMNDHNLKMSWKGLRILLAGGGSQNATIRKRLEKSRASIVHAFHNCTDVSYEVSVYEPTSIDANGVSKKRFPGFLLPVADGLSIERRRWPEFIEPKRIEPIPPTDFVRPEIDTWNK